MTTENILRSINNIELTSRDNSLNETIIELQENPNNKIDLQIDIN